MGRPNLPPFFPLLVSVEYLPIRKMLSRGWLEMEPTDPEKGHICAKRVLPAKWITSGLPVIGWEELSIADSIQPETGRRLIRLLKDLRRLPGAQGKG